MNMVSNCLYPVLLLDLPFGVNLCAAEFRNVEEHIRQCNEVQWNDELEEFDHEIPCDLDFPSGSIYGVCHSHTGTIKDRNIYEGAEEQQAQQQVPESNTGAEQKSNDEF